MLYKQDSSIVVPEKNLLCGIVSTAMKILDKKTFIKRQYKIDL